MATRWPQILQCWKSFITRFYIENFSTKPLTHTIILSPPPPPRTVWAWGLHLRLLRSGPRCTGPFRASISASSQSPLGKAASLHPLLGLGFWLHVCPLLSFSLMLARPLAHVAGKSAEKRTPDFSGLFGAGMATRYDLTPMSLWTFAHRTSKLAFSLFPMF